MRAETSWEVRTRQLEAILGTARPTVLLRLASSDVLGILEGWLWTGDADRQMTFLRLLLQTAARLPFPPAMLQNSNFLKAVGVLQRYRSAVFCICISTPPPSRKSVVPLLLPSRTFPNYSPRIYINRGLPPPGYTKTQSGPSYFVHFSKNAPDDASLAGQLQCAGQL